MTEIVTWHGNRFPQGGYGWNSMGVVVMSERHPEEEHPLRGPTEDPLQPVREHEEPPKEGEEQPEKEEPKE